MARHVKVLSPKSTDLGRESLSPIDLITSRTPVMAEIKRLIRQVAASDITVLINGESGTGKELVARAIHSLSRRRGGALVSLNCGAIPEGIFESEIFGHERGSFTSASERRRGYFEMAHRGTLFLDEIGEMPLPVQVKILRVLESGTFVRVGGSEEISVDVRVIAATNKDLTREVARGMFRQDLYFRLKAVTITIPPLRERMEDIPSLILQFAEEFSHKNNRPAPDFEPEALNMMKRHYWTGNVRELKNFVESLIALTQHSSIGYEEVANRLTPDSASPNLPVIVSRPSDEFDRELLYRTLLELRSDMSVIKSLLQEVMNSQRKEVGVRYDAAEEVESFTLDDIEKEQIRKTLQEFGNNRRQAARALGIGERTLYRKINRYGL